MTGSTGGGTDLQLHIIARDKILCNRLLSGLRRDGLPVAATVAPTCEHAIPDCDLLLLVDGEDTGAGDVVARYRAEQPGFPLLVANNGDPVTGPAEAGVEFVPVCDLPRLLQTLKHLLHLQRERKCKQRLVRQLHTLENRHQALLAQSPNAIALIAQGKHLVCNTGYASLFGFHNTGELEQHSLTSLVAKADVAPLQQLLAGNTDGASITITTAGEPAIPITLAFTASIYKHAPCFQVLATRARGAGGDDRGRDLITRLDNLPRFTARLESAITAAVTDNITSLLLVARIDRFRHVQETIGKAATLQVIADIAGFLEHGINKPFTATRLAPDEFGILLFNSTIGEGTRLADYISSKVNASLLPPTADDIVLGASLGLAVINRHTMDGDDVIRRARMNTGNVRKHGSAASSLLPQAADMAQTIRQALADNRMALMYQPLVPLRSATNTGFEVTFILHDNNGNPMSVDGLLACANIQSVATAIDRHMLQRVFATPGETLFQVPLSSDSLASPDMLEWLSKQLRQQAFQGSRLQLQVSEIDLHSNEGQVREFCAGLDALGIPRVLADFGSALEPLPVLAAIRPDCVRLDPLLVRDLPYSRQQQDKLGKLIDAVHHQQAAVAATGLEDISLLPLLWDLGVDYVQGDCLQPPQAAPLYVFPEEQEISLPAGVMTGFGNHS